MMRGKSSSSKSNKGGLEPANKLDDESNVSAGAYIRSLVKQLSSSSRAKDPCDQCSTDLNKDFVRPHRPPPRQHKKQGRPRLHTTSRPCEDRQLLNMAEARREIITALKVHRAAKRKAGEEIDEGHQQKKESGHGIIKPCEPSTDHSSVEHHDAESRSTHASKSSISDRSAVNYVDHDSHSREIFSPYSWSMPSQIPTQPLTQENLDFALASQTLGLGLNLQDFNNLDALAFSRSTNPSNSLSSSASTSSSSPLSANTEVIQCVGAQGLENPCLHHGNEDKEMAEIRTIGKLHQMELNDAMNQVDSSQWSEFLKAEDKQDANFGYSPFDEVIELPAWLNAKEESYVNDSFSDNYLQDPGLPW